MVSFDEPLLLSREVLQDRREERRVDGIDAQAAHAVLQAPVASPHRFLLRALARGATDTAGGRAEHLFEQPQLIRFIRLAFVIEQGREAEQPLRRERGWR